MGLNSRQGGGGDLPSLDLAFALDKTLTARKGPTPTFTRVQATSTGSTYIGADRLIKYAAANEPRFDHDPATGVCKGLLIEEPRTNLLTYSEDMTVANGWNEDINSGTVAWSNNATTSPTGLVTAEKLTEASTTPARRITSKSVVTVGGTTYTLSVYAKASERSILQIAAAAGFTTVTQNFDLTNVALGTGDATGPSIVSVGGGWCRCSIQVVSSATGTSLFAFGMAPAATSGRFTAYTGVVGNGIFLWGAQLEAGAFPTSYIPTTSGTAARSADVCSIIGDPFSSFYNQSEGTIFIKGSTINPGNNAILYALSDGTISNFIQALPGTGSFTVVSLGGTQASLNHGNFVANIESAQASAYKLNDFASSKNGATSLIDTTGTVPTVSQLGIGSRLSSVQLNGHIARIQYFRKRLSNAKLQTLTAP